MRVYRMNTYDNNFIIWLIIVDRIVDWHANSWGFITFQVLRRYGIAHFSDILRNMDIDLPDENLFYTKWGNSCSETCPSRIVRRRTVLFYLNAYWVAHFVTCISVFSLDVLCKIMIIQTISMRLTMFRLVIDIVFFTFAAK